MSVCMNCSQYDSNDVDVISVLIKICVKLFTYSWLEHPGAVDVCVYEL